jgi:hypothetical protein
MKAAREGRAKKNVAHAVCRVRAALTHARARLSTLVRSGVHPAQSVVLMPADEGSMADFLADTRIDAVPDQPGRFRAELSPSWAVWGPNGGYLAAIA